PCAKKSRDGNPHQPPPLQVDFTGLGTDGRQTASRSRFGCTDGRRTNILGSIAATGRGCFRRFRFWFGRISFRARHALPPGFVVLENNLAATESAARSTSGYGLPQITERSRKDFDSPATDGDGCPQHTNIFSDGLEKLWGGGVIAGSVKGPKNWESLMRKNFE